MNIKEAIATINQMQADGVIERYGILARHGLVDAWKMFERQFLSDTP